MNNTKERQAYDQFRDATKMVDESRISELERTAEICYDNHKRVVEEK